jgi:type VI secretion system protein ImpG
MDPRLLQLYSEELSHVREMGAEFAQEYPKIAARLGMEGIAVADPYVERLIEGFAFVAARIRLKLDAEFPRFSEQLLQIVYPQFLAPVPAMGIAQFRPKTGTSLLSAPISVPRGTKLRAPLARGESTACEFRTSHALSIWPLELKSAKVFSYAPDLALTQLQTRSPVRGGVRLRFEIEEGLAWKDSECDSLALHLCGPGDSAYKLYELMLARCQGLLVLDGAGEVLTHLGAEHVQAEGFDDLHSMLPVTGQQFVGFRLLMEYFAFAKRYLFVRLSGLRPHLRRMRPGQRQFELVVLSGGSDTALEASVDAGHLLLNATPIINLFERPADRILIGDHDHEHHLVVDRARPGDFEVYSILSVRGFRKSQVEPIEFAPFYAGYDAQEAVGGQAFFAMRREPTRLSGRQLKRGTRTSYEGGEIFLSLVDTNESPYATDLDQLAAQVMVTNRDMPLLMSGGAAIRLNVEGLSTVDEAWILEAPTRPRTRSVEAQHPWRLISHLSLNFMSLTNTEHSGAAAALKEMLALYTQPGDQGASRQIEGLRRVDVRAVVRRLPLDGPIAFARGLEVSCRVDESAFAGAGAFIFASVLERFLAHYVSVNSFSQLVLISEQRGEISRWPARSGHRVLL